MNSGPTKEAREEAEAAFAGGRYTRAARLYDKGGLLEEAIEKYQGLAAKAEQLASGGEHGSDSSFASSWRKARQGYCKMTAALQRVAREKAKETESK